MKVETPYILWHYFNNKSVPVVTVDTHPSGRLATAGCDGIVRIWKVRHEPIPGTKQNPDSQQSTKQDEGPPSLLRYESQQLPPFHVDFLSEFSESDANVNTIRFSPNGHLLAVVTDNKHVTLYRYSGPVGTVDNPTQFGTDLGHYNVEVWQRCSSRLNGTDEVISIAWMPDSLSFYTSSLHGAVTTWTVSDRDKNNITSIMNVCMKMSIGSQHPIQIYPYRSLLETNGGDQSDTKESSKTAAPNATITTSNINLHIDKALPTKRIQLPASDIEKLLAHFHHLMIDRVYRLEWMYYLSEQKGVLPSTSTNTTATSTVTSATATTPAASTTEASIPNKANEFESILPTLTTLPNPIGLALYTLSYDEYCYFSQTPTCSSDGSVIAGAIGGTYGFKSLGKQQQVSDWSPPLPITGLALPNNHETAAAQPLPSPPPNPLLPRNALQHFTLRKDSIINPYEDDLQDSDPSSSTGSNSMSDANTTSNTPQTRQKYVTRIESIEEVPLTAADILKYAAMGELLPVSATQKESSESNTTAAAEPSGSLVATPSSSALASDQDTPQKKKNKKDNSLFVIDSDSEDDDDDDDQKKPHNLNGAKKDAQHDEKSDITTPSPTGTATTNTKGSEQGQTPTTTPPSKATPSRTVVQFTTTAPMAVPPEGIQQLCLAFTKTSLPFNLNTSHAQGIICDPFGLFVVALFADREMVIFRPSAPGLGDILAKHPSGKKSIAAGGDISSVSSYSGHKQNTRPPLDVVERLTKYTVRDPTLVAAGITECPLFFKETKPLFFRRPDWSPDGAFLAAPCGLCYLPTSASGDAQPTDDNKDTSADDVVHVPTSSIQTAQQTEKMGDDDDVVVDSKKDQISIPSQPHILQSSIPSASHHATTTTTSTTNAGAPGATTTHQQQQSSQSLTLEQKLSQIGYSEQNCTHIFHRNNLTTPILSLPGTEETIAVRFSPHPFITPDNIRLSRDIISDYERYMALPASERDFFPCTLPVNCSISTTSYYYLLAVASLNRVTIYRTDTFQPIAFVTGIHFEPITDVAWLHDGFSLVVTSRDGYCSFIRFDSAELDPQMSGSLKGVYQHTLRSYKQRIALIKQHNELLATTKRMDVITEAYYQLQYYLYHVLQQIWALPAYTPVIQQWMFGTLQLHINVHPFDQPSAALLKSAATTAKQLTQGTTTTASHTATTPTPATPRKTPSKPVKRKQMSTSEEDDDVNHGETPVKSKTPSKIKKEKPPPAVSDEDAFKYLDEYFKEHEKWPTKAQFRKDLKIGPTRTNELFTAHGADVKPVQRTPITPSGTRRSRRLLHQYDETDQNEGAAENSGDGDQDTDDGDDDDDNDEHNTSDSGDEGNHEVNTDSGDRQPQPTNKTNRVLEFPTPATMDNSGASMDNSVETNIDASNTTASNRDNTMHDDQPHDDLVFTISAMSDENNPLLHPNHHTTSSNNNVFPKQTIQGDGGIGGGQANTAENNE